MRGYAASLLLLFLAAIEAATAGLQWTEQKAYRYAEVKPSGSGKVGFTSILPQSTGITFTNRIPAERHYTNQIYLNGSGVAAGDVDGDG